MEMSAYERIRDVFDATLVPVGVEIARLSGLDIQTTKDPVKAKNKLVNHITRAQKSLHIVTGNGRTYIEPMVLETMQRLCAANPSSVRIFAGPDLDEEVSQKLSELKLPLIRLDYKPSEHTVLVDDRFARIEWKHGPNEKMRTQAIIGSELLGSTETILNIINDFHDLEHNR